MPFESVPEEIKKQYPEPCLSPEHRPPMHVVLEPGPHRWRCPSCGHVTDFNVPRVTW